MIWNSFLTFFRNIKKNTAYMLINIFGLALGVTVSFLILLFVQGELSYDKFNENYNEIYRLEREDWGVFSPIYGEVITRDFPEVVDFVRLDPWSYSDALVRWGEERIKVQDFILADTSFFKIFTFDFVEGNASILKDKQQVVITDKIARSIFGNAPAVGQTIKVDNAREFTIGAVVRAPKNFHLSFDIVGNFDLLRERKGAEYFQQYDRWSHPIYFQTAKGVNVQDLTAKINQQLSKVPTFDGEDPHFRLRPMKELYFAHDVKYEAKCKHGNKTYVFLFLAIAFLILTIAIINFVNLTTARAPLRAREVGVRKVFGVQREGLMLQFLSESMILSVLAFAIALLGIIELLPLFNLIMESNLDLHFLSEAQFWMVFGGSIFLVGILSGIYPSLVLTSYQSVEVFKSKSPMGGGGTWFRRVLIVFQFTVSIILIVFTLCIYLQLDYFRNRDLGMDKDLVLFVPLNSDVRNQQEVLQDKLERLPHVQKVAFSLHVPGQIHWEETWPVNEDESVQFTFFKVDPGYPEFMDFQLVEGRWFSKDRMADRKNAYVLNETAVREFGLKPPYLKTYNLRDRDEDVEVIGIVKDFHFNSLHQAISPLVIGWSEYGAQYMNVKLDGVQLSASIWQIKEIWDEFSPEFPFDYQFLDESFDALYKKESNFAQMFVWFSLLAILIASLGLFGLAAFTTQQRSKEIGVRKVLGASDNLIAKLLLGEFGRWILVAGIIALPVSWFGIGQWLSRFHYHMEIQFWVFGAGLFICFAVAMLTVSFHTYRAANLNPVDAIKHD